MDEKKVLICKGGMAVVEHIESIAKSSIGIAKKVWGENGVFVINVTGCSENRILMFACWYGGDHARGADENFADYMKRKFEVVDTTKENWWDELKAVEK